MATGKIQKAVVVSLGLIAAGTAIWLCLLDPSPLFRTGRSTVEALVEKLKGSSRADAAWAYEKLKEMPDERIEELLPFVASEETVKLSEIPFVPKSGEKKWIHFGTSGTVGEVVQAVLCERVGVTYSPFADSEGVWRSRLEEWRRAER